MSTTEWESIGVAATVRAVLPQPDTYTVDVATSAPIRSDWLSIFRRALEGVEIHDVHASGFAYTAKLPDVIESFRRIQLAADVTNRLLLERPFRAS